MCTHCVPGAGLGAERDDEKYKLAQDVSLVREGDTEVPKVN